MHAFLNTLPGGFCAMIVGYVVFLPIPWALKRSGILDEAEETTEETCEAAIVPGTNRRV